MRGEAASPVGALGHEHRGSRRSRGLRPAVLVLVSGGRCRRADKVVAGRSATPSRARTGAGADVRLRLARSERHGRPPYPPRVDSAPAARRRPAGDLPRRPVGGVPAAPFRGVRLSAIGHLRGTWHRDDRNP